MSEKQVQCPWCNEQITAKSRTYSGPHGDVLEKKCPKCDSVIASYLAEKESVLKSVRTFHE